MKKKQLCGKGNRFNKLPKQLQGKLMCTKERNLPKLWFLSQVIHIFCNLLPRRDRYKVYPQKWWRFSHFFLKWCFKPDNRKKLGGSSPLVLLRLPGGKERPLAVEGLRESVAKSDDSTLAAGAATLHHHSRHLHQLDGALPIFQCLGQVQHLRTSDVSLSQAPNVFAKTVIYMYRWERQFNYDTIWNKYNMYKTLNLCLCSFFPQFIWFILSKYI